MTKQPSREKSNLAIPLYLDRQGGTAHSGATPARLRIRQPRLRYLDLSACPQLQELDLSACAEELYLTIRDCPQLARIHLPASGAGAVVHIDAGTAPPALEVLGPIRQLDASWQGGEFAAEAHKALPPLRNAAVGLDDAAIVHSETPYDLIALLGQAQLPELLAIIRPLRQLIVQGQARLQRLSVAAADTLDAVHLTDCPALMRLDCQAPIRRLRISRCAAFNELHASGYIARVSGCGAGALRVHGGPSGGAWQQLSCVDSALTSLVAPQVPRLLLRDCPQLTRAELQPGARVVMSGRCVLAPDAGTGLELDQQAVTGLLARAGQGDLAAVATLRAWCGQRSKPRQALETVRALASVAAEYPDPLELWTLRCRLHAMHGPSRQEVPSDEGCLQFAQQRWRWLFPEDLVEEGWNADLRLWLACRARINETKGPVHRAGRALTRAQNLLALVAVANLLLAGDEPVETQRHLRHLLGKGLRSRPNPGARRPLDNPRPHEPLERLLQALIGLRDGELAQLYIKQIPWHLTPVAQLPLLARLAAVGHAGARAALVGHAQKFGRRQPGLRAQAMAMALRPVQTQMFAITQEIPLNA